MLVPTSILLKGENAYESVDRRELETLADLLTDSFDAYNIKILVEDIKPTPSIIRFEISVAKGTRICDITAKKKDLQLLMKKPCIGIEAPIPGTNRIAIDIPNDHSITPRLRNLLDNEDFQKASETTIPIGSNTNNKPLLFDIATHQHLLITGSDIHEVEGARDSIIVSMLCKALYQNVKMLIIDTTDRVPSVYDELRQHLLMPVGSNHHYAVEVINKAINILDRRIDLMRKATVKSIKSLDQAPPQIMIFINAIDDLLKFKQDDVYPKLCKLISQGAFAGMHLIITTKINLRSRAFLMLNDRIRNKVVFRVDSTEESLKVIYHDGAESLMSNGDMYFYERPTNLCIRSNSPQVTNIEIYDACKYFMKEN